MSLAIADVSKRFGGIAALDGLSFEVPDGRVTGLIGPNGSGKTTLFNVVSGLLAPDSGSIRYGSHRLDGQWPHRIVRLGVARTFQTTRLFPSLTVRQNVAVSAQRGGEAEVRRRADDLLELIGLGAYADSPAEGLSFGQSRLIEFARALMAEPRLLLLDEPFAGLAPAIAATLEALIAALPERGVSVLLIEHNMEVAMRLCPYFFVLDRGRLIAEGAPAAVRADPAVRDAYLGTADPLKAIAGAVDAA